MQEKDAAARDVILSSSQKTDQVAFHSKVG